MSQRPPATGAFCLGCGTDLLPPFAECHRCGLVQAKFRERSRATSTARSSGVGLDPAGRSALVRGGLLALVVYLVPFTRFVFGYLGVLVHELGHAATAWLLATPAIPALDFAYGGGATFHGSRSLLLAVVLFAGWVWAILAAGRRRLLRNLLALGLVAWTLVVVTPLRELAIVAMGHGAELVVATIFLYRAISGRALRTPAERPAYAFAGGFLTLVSVDFAARLLSSALFRREYATAKGGHPMDFTRLADGIPGLDLELVAAIFFLASCLPPVLAWLWFRNRR